MLGLVQRQDKNNNQTRTREARAKHREVKNENSLAARKDEHDFHRRQNDDTSLKCSVNETRCERLRHHQARDKRESASTKKNRIVVSGNSSLS